MTIHIWGIRKKSFETFHDCPPKHEKSIDEALVSIIVFELAYGGYPISIEPNHIVVQTQVMGCIDEVHVTGEENELQPLHLALSFWKEACTSVDTETLSYQLVEMTKGPPLEIAMMATLLLGQNRVKACILLASGANDEQLKDAMDLEKLNPEDALALVRLSQETGKRVTELHMELY